MTKVFFDFKNSIEDKIRSFEEFSLFLNYYTKQQESDYQLLMKSFYGNHAKEYFNILNPVMLHSFSANELDSFVNYMLVRDGALSLMNFFLRYPSPQERWPVLLIRRDLEYLIPYNWREKVLLWNYESLQSQDIKKMLIVVNVVEEHECDEARIKLDLECVVNFLQKAPKAIDVEIYPVYMDANPDIDICDAAEKFNFLVHQKLSRIKKFIGQEIKIVNSELFWKQLSFEGVLVYELDTDFFYFADSSVTRHVLFHGGSTLNTNVFREKKDTNVTIPASPYLKYVITPLNKEIGFYETYINSDQALILREEWSGFLEDNAFKNSNKFCSKSLESSLRFFIKQNK